MTHGRRLFYSIEFTNVIKPEEFQLYALIKQS